MCVLVVVTLSVYYYVCKWRRRKNRFCGQFMHVSMVSNHQFCLVCNFNTSEDKNEWRFYWVFRWNLDTYIFLFLLHRHTIIFAMLAKCFGWKRPAQKQKPTKDHRIALDFDTWSREKKFWVLRFDTLSHCRMPIKLCVWNKTKRSETHSNEQSAANALWLIESMCVMTFTEILMKYFLSILFKFAISDDWRWPINNFNLFCEIRSVLSAESAECRISSSCHEIKKPYFIYVHVSCFSMIASARTCVCVFVYVWLRVLFCTTHWIICVCLHQIDEIKSNAETQYLFSFHRCSSSFVIHVTERLSLKEGDRKRTNT